MQTEKHMSTWHKELIYAPLGSTEAHNKLDLKLQGTVDNEVVPKTRLKSVSNS